MDNLPKIISGFYSAALLNLSVILDGTGIKIINVAYDLKDYKNEQIKKSFKTVTNLPQFKSIEQLNYNVLFNKNYSSFVVKNITKRNFLFFCYFVVS